MPTENRSSNTEQMVSVQRDEVERLVKLLAYQAHPYPSPHAEYWQGVLDQPAAQHLGNSKLVDNIHALLALDARGALVPSGIGGLARELLESSAAALSAQHQGEPVAYAVFADNGNIRIWSTNCEAVGIKVMQEEGKQAVPLYGHPTTSDGFSAGDMADQGAKAFREGVAASANFIQKRMDDYLNEFGAIDPETGSVELPRGGDEYVGELQEIIEAVRALPMPQ